MRAGSLVFLLVLAVSEFASAKIIGDCDKARTDAVTCMACNLYHEAREEAAECKEAIAHVVINRKMEGGFGDSICGVIWKRSQFSWTNDGKPDYVYDSDNGWQESVEVAKKVLDGRSEDKTDNSLWYHANYVNPDWAQDYTPVGKCDAHIFYRRPKAGD